jgi:glycosyltransferase involved in cell wall biosynthesis
MLRPLLAGVCKPEPAWQIGAVQADRLTTFLIPAYNEQALIGRAVESIHGAAAAVELTAYEVIVCDNASTDRTADIARAEGARVIHEPHRQIARARNAAAAASGGDWLIWIDADAVLTQEVLAGTLSALTSGKCCGGGARVRLEGAPLGRAARQELAEPEFSFGGGFVFFCAAGRMDGNWRVQRRGLCGRRVGFCPRAQALGAGAGLGFSRAGSRGAVIRT